MSIPSRPSLRSKKRPAPRNAPGPPPSMHDNITWSREIQPRELYRILYQDRDYEQSFREIELLRIGAYRGETYIGVMHAGKFKTMRADRILQVESLSQGQPASIHAYPTYNLWLPAFPRPEAVFRVPTVKGNRTWKVDLNTYTCACPEKRIRVGLGYAPGQLGFVCPHVARAILDHLPAELHGASEWSNELLSFLADPRKMHIDNLT